MANQTFPTRTLLACGAVAGPVYVAVTTIQARLLSQLGRLYGANTIGGVLGSFAAGFLLIPALGAERSLQAVALLFCANGAALACFARDVERPARTRALVVAAAIAGVVLLLRPHFLEGWMLERSASQRMTLEEVVDGSRRNVPSSAPMRVQQLSL